MWFSKIVPIFRENELKNIFNIGGKGLKMQKVKKKKQF